MHGDEPPSAADVSHLLASLRERALELEDAVATVRRGEREGRGRLRERDGRAAACGGATRRRQARARFASLATHGRRRRGRRRPLRPQPPSPPSSSLLQDEAARLDAWTAEKPELKAFIGALVESRALLRRELARLDGGGAPPPPPEPVPGGGAVTGFNVMR